MITFEPSAVRKTLHGHMDSEFDCIIIQVRASVTRTVPHDCIIIQVRASVTRAALHCTSPWVDEAPIPALVTKKLILLFTLHFV